MKYLRTLFLTLILLSLASSAWCGWWIFGKSQDEVATTYLYLNGISYDEIAEKATIYGSSLENGEIVLKGKATAGKNSIAMVEVSLDGKETWQTAPMERGVFNYRFTPQADKVYELYLRITDTTGRTNNVEATHRRVMVSGQNIRTMVIDVLSRMIDAYQNKNTTAFMAMVSPDFAGDPVNVDRAIRRDFSSFDNIRLSFTVNSVVSPDGKVAVSITYNRSLIGTRSGSVFRDNGITDFTFVNDGGALKLFSMKNPLIFGLSDAQEVATGSAANSPNTPVIVIDPQGNIGTVPFKNTVSSDGASVTIDFSFQ